MAVLLVTFLLTVFFDLTIAIELGLLLAMLLFMKRMVDTTKVSVVKDAMDLSHESDVHEREEILIIPKHVEVCMKLTDLFSFGVASKFDECMKQMRDKPRVRIIVRRFLSWILQGYITWKAFSGCLPAEGITIVLSGSIKEFAQCLKTAA